MHKIKSAGSIRKNYLEDKKNSIWQFKNNETFYLF